MLWRVFALLGLLIFTKSVWALYGGQEVALLPSKALARNVMLLVQGDIRRDFKNARGCAAVFVESTGTALLTVNHCLGSDQELSLWRPLEDMKKVIQGRNLVDRGPWTQLKKEQIDKIPNADLALIYLKQPVPNAEPMKLADDFQMANHQSTQLPMQILGFGADLEDSVDMVLRWLPNVEILNHQLPPTEDELENPNLLFLDQISSGKGICRGDSGGPLFYRTDSGEAKLVALAIQSKGSKNKNYCNHSGIFLKIAPFAAEIRQRISARTLVK